MSEDQEGGKIQFPFVPVLGLRLDFDEFVFRLDDQRPFAIIRRLKSPPTLEQLLLSSAPNDSAASVLILQAGAVGAEIELKQITGKQKTYIPLGRAGHP